MRSKRIGSCAHAVRSSLAIGIAVFVEVAGRLSRRLPEDVLQRFMRHQASSTTRHYINVAARMKRAGTAERLHVPPVLQKRAAN